MGYPSSSKPYLFFVYDKQIRKVDLSILVGLFFYPTPSSLEYDLCRYKHIPNLSTSIGSPISSSLLYLIGVEK